MFCLVIFENFVYLHTVKDVAIICPPYYINVKNLKLSRKVLNLSLLRSALRKIVMSGEDGKFSQRGNRREKENGKAL